MLSSMLHTISVRRLAQASVPTMLQTRSMSFFQSKFQKQRYRREKKKSTGRVKDPDPSHAKQMPIFDYTSSNPMTRIYTWGMACFGALGVPEYVCPPHRSMEPLKTMHRPARCSYAELEGTSLVACGYGFTLFVKKTHNVKEGYQVMGTGINNCGQIGYHEAPGGHPLDILIRPVGIPLPTRHSDGKIIHASCGRAHSILATKSGSVFSLGDNAHGQCGREIINDEDYAAYKEAHRLSNAPWGQERIKAVTCGQDHSLFLTDAGSVFSCGWGADGQTGLGHYDSVGKPQQAKADIKGENIVKVATSTDCVLALNASGQVFGWGNSEYGQFRSVTSEQQLCNPTHVPLKGLGKIIDIACGGTICMALNENHDVFVWGYGLLGKGPDLEYSVKPQLIPGTLFGRNDFAPQVRVTTIHAGVNTNGCINSIGELFIWGKNKGSCLGLGDWKDQPFPLKVSLMNEVKQVSLGVDHTAAVCNPMK